jgi:hypothetical protein
MCKLNCELSLNGFETSIYKYNYYFATQSEIKITNVLTFSSFETVVIFKIQFK